MSQPVAAGPLALEEARAPTRAAVVGLGCTVVLGVGLASVAARHAHPAEVSPVVPAGAWNAVWVAGLLAALACYGLGAFLAAHGRIRVGVALGIAVAVQALPLVGPVVLSKDVFAYWAQARVLTVHHANPYRAAPGDYPSDPALPFVSEQWRSAPPPYGPAWEALGTAPAGAAGRSVDRAQLGYRVLALLSVVAAVALVARRTRNPGAVAFLGWNPLVAIHFAGGGHNDGWMVALLVLAVVARYRARAGAAWPIAAAFKVVPLALLPLELAAARLRLPRRYWVGMLATGVGVAAAATVAFGTRWIGASLGLAHQSAPLGGVHWLMEAGLSHRVAVAAGGVVFVALYTALLRSAWRTSRARLSLAATALCLCSTVLRPWYVLWPVALAAAEEDRTAAAAAFGLTAYLLLGDAIRL